ncbi:MAG: IS110 family transposase [Cyanobacteria bacterium RM1_2_2]|nr:IS110 family transposase [Cyanobacteria bacterium RM1_2_2]
MTCTICLGIDISKASFHAAVLKAQNRANVKEFANTEAGFEALSEWLAQQGVEQVHGCLEATSIYGHALATYLHSQGHVVSIVNPARIKGYGQSQLRRTQNDRADAKLIAQFCRDIKPAAWQPSEAMVQELQAFTRRLEALEQMVTQEKNRLGITPTALKGDIEAHIEFLEEQITAVKKRLHEHIQAQATLKDQHQLLTTIVGVGDYTASVVLAEIGCVRLFSSARQLAAFAGLTPQEHQSGTSVQGKTRLCKVGSVRLRKALYFPALNLIRRCPQIGAFRDRLLAAGKTKMQVVGAVMHKLIRVIYGVLHSKQPFDPTKLCPAP